MKRILALLISVLVIIFSGCGRSKTPPMNEIVSIKFSWDMGGDIPNDPDYRDSYAIFVKDGKVFFAASSLNDYPHNPDDYKEEIELPASVFEDVKAITEKHDMLSWKSCDEQNVMGGASFALVVDWENTEKRISTYGILEEYGKGRNELRDYFKKAIEKYA